MPFYYRISQHAVRKFSKHALSTVLGLLLFTAALVLLNHVLREYDYRQILVDLTALPKKTVLLAIGLTCLNYFVLTSYDTLAFIYIKHRFKFAKIALTAFVGYAFSQSLGIPLLTGGAIRYRLYSAWGLSAVEIAQVVSFSAVTFWLGILSVGGLALVLQPMFIPHSLRLPFVTTFPLGIVLLLIVAGYCSIVAFAGRTIRIRGWEFTSPSLLLCGSQILLSSIDWILAAAVLYILLPSGIVSFPGFLGVFLTAQVLGLISNIPGGLGVFESILILLLSSRVKASVLIGPLVAYRTIYYLFPLLIASIIFGSHELLRRKSSVKRIFETWIPKVAPTAYSILIFLAGVILLFSSATPAVQARMIWIQRLLPLTVVELSHFTGSIAGIGLLLVARGLQRKVDAAYGITLGLLGTGVVVSLLKGLDYEEALVLAILFLMLLPCRRLFYRRASLTKDPFTLEWTAAIVLVLLSSLWLVLFSYKHLPYSKELWWQFTFSGDAPRSLRALAGSIGFSFLCAVVWLLRPMSPQLKLPQQRELEMANTIIERSPQTYANLALLGDKQLLFSASGNSFLMYGVEGRTWVALGDPVGEPEEYADLAWQFHEMAHRQGGWTVFYELSKEALPLYLDLGLTLLKIGEEATVTLKDFSLEGGSRKPLRHLMNRLHKDGCTFEITPRECVPDLLPEFKIVSDLWLSQKNTREKGFSLGFFDESYLRHFPAAVIRKDSRILAFSNIWCGAENQELSLDLMRYRPEAPEGVMEFLFLNLLLWGKEQGYRAFNLGMAPLSGFTNRALAPFWNRLGSFLFRHGEHFYNFQGLRAYKQKFDPVWTPKYLACPGGLALPRILTNVAALISGGLKGVVTK